MITDMLIALVVGLELLDDPFDHIFVKLIDSDLLFLLDLIRRRHPLESLRWALAPSSWHHHGRMHDLVRLGTLIWLILVLRWLKVTCRLLIIILSLHQI